MGNDHLDHPAHVADDIRGRSLRQRRALQQEENNVTGDFNLFIQT